MPPIRPRSGKPNDGAAAAPQIEEQDEAAASLAAFLERNGADEAQAYVHRKTPEGWAFVDKQPISDLDEKAIRDRYGAGTYRVRIMVRGGKWQGGVYTFHVAQAAQPSTVPDVNTIMSAQVMQMLAMQQQAMQGMATLFQSLAQKQSDPVQTALAIVQAIKPTAATGGVDTFLEGVKFAREIAPESGEGMGLEGLAVTLGKPLLEMARAAQSRDEARRRNPPRPVPQAPSAPHVLPSPAPTVPHPHWLDTFRPYLSLLIKPAQRDADPGDYVGMILDNTPDATYSEVEAAARHDVNFINRTVERAIFLCSPLQPYRAWVESLARELQSAIVQDGDAGEGDADSDQGDA